MSDPKKSPRGKSQDGVTMAVSFLVGAAIGIGLILLAESKSSKSEESYGEADLFV